MTFVLGSKSLAALEGVHPDLVAVVKQAIGQSVQDFGVYEGLRTLERQKEYVARGVSRTLASAHLKHPDGFGHAVDLVPYIDGQLRWEWGAIYPITLAMRNAAMMLGVRLRWGGVWDRTLNDIPGATTADIRKAVEAYSVRHPGPDFLDGPHMELAK